MSFGPDLPPGDEEFDDDDGWPSDFDEEPWSDAGC